MLECDHCGFKFILLYPAEQRLTHGYSNNEVRCPVCRGAVTQFIRGEENPNTLVKME